MLLILFHISKPLYLFTLQRIFERKAALMGGGNFVVPVQTVPDFLDNRLSGQIQTLSLSLNYHPFLNTYLDYLYFVVTSVPPSSYQLGVKPANLHDLFPLQITEALQRALSMFDEEV